MAGNIFGNALRLVTFGESHGPAVGGILEGFPAGVNIDMEAIYRMMQRRRPGTSGLVSSRAEKDEISFYSGIENGMSTGGPIAFWVYNNDKRPSDYSHLKDVFRPGHADFTYWQKYGAQAGSGGGRASARETLARVAGGALAAQLLLLRGIHIAAYIHRIHDISCPASWMEESTEKIELCHDKELPCPDQDISMRMTKIIETASENGDSLGGSIVCVINGLPPGLGEPVFDKLPALLAHAQMSIQATRYFSWGRGWESTHLSGSQNNDAFTSDGGKISTSSNHAAGSLGGISNGMPVFFEVGFKPVSSIAGKQKTVNKTGTPVEIEINGRHDPCVLPRAVPIVEAMASLVLADLLLRNQTAIFTGSH
ncbi:MAG: chorismate synthase [Bacteroidota bacterium]|jgi:chorismate synthase